jgi:hypothetical protein
MGGSDEPSNLITLTIEEHAQAHKDLYEKCGKIEDQIAFRMLSGQITAAEASHLARKHRDTSYMKTEEYRTKISKANKNKEPWNKGKKGVQIFSDEVRKKKSDMNLGSKNPNSKRVKFEGTIYDTLKQCVEANRHKITRHSLGKHPSFSYL